MESPVIQYGLSTKQQCTVSPQGFWLYVLLAEFQSTRWRNQGLFPLSLDLHDCFSVCCPENGHQVSRENGFQTILFLLPCLWSTFPCRQHHISTSFLLLVTQREQMSLCRYCQQSWIVVFHIGIGKSGCCKVNYVHHQSYWLKSFWFLV